VLVHEPVADADEARHEYGVAVDRPGSNLPAGGGNCSRRRRIASSSSGHWLIIAGKLQKGGVLADVKSMFNAAELVLPKG
jgi:hypothetical protein